MGHGIAQIGFQFGERFQNEAALSEAWMRNLQIRLVYYVIPSQNQVQVERPRSALGRASPAGRRFDRSQGLEQLPRRQRRLPHPDRVQVRRIVLEPVTDGSGFDDSGKPEGREQRGNFGRGLANRGATIAEIGTECYNDHGLEDES